MNLDISNQNLYNSQITVNYQDYTQLLKQLQKQKDIYISSIIIQRENKKYLQVYSNISDQNILYVCYNIPIQSLIQNQMNLESHLYLKISACSLIQPVKGQNVQIQIIDNNVLQIDQKSQVQIQYIGLDELNNLHQIQQIEQEIRFTHDGEKDFINTCKNLSKKVWLLKISKKGDLILFDSLSINNKIIISKDYYSIIENKQLVNDYNVSFDILKMKQVSQIRFIIDSDQNIFQQYFEKNLLIQQQLQKKQDLTDLYKNMK